MLRPADIAEIDWDRATLQFTPTLDIAPLTTNAPAIWSALAANETPPGSELLVEAGAILVWRHEQVSSFRATDPIERQALLWARSGMPFSELCEALVTLDGETEGVARAGRYLGQWIADGLIVSA
jgi:hypothetical protein